MSPPGEPVTQALAAGRAPAGRHGRRTAPTALLPLALGSGNVGVLALAWTADLEPVATDVMAPLTDFAQQAGLALIAARAQRDRSRMALLEDRDRIARDMHDHVIQRLFATGLSLQSAARLAQHPTVRVRLDDAVDDLDSADQGHPAHDLRAAPSAAGRRPALRGRVPRGLLRRDPRVRPRAGDPGPAHRTVALARGGRHRGGARGPGERGAARPRRAGCRARLVAGPELSWRSRDDGVGIDPGSARSGLVNLGARASARSGHVRAAPAGARAAPA